jgi:serine protease Do
MSKIYYRALALPVMILLVVTLAAGHVPQIAWASAPPALKQMEENLALVAEKITPAVVNISVSKKMAQMGPVEETPPFGQDNPLKEFFGDEFFKRFRKGPEQDTNSRMHGMGSGVIVSPDGYILTNAHVVKDADEITINLSDKRSLSAKVVGVDPDSDIAVIKIDARNLPAAAFGDSDKMRVGSFVMAVGSPFGLNRTVTSGIVSAKGRTNMGIVDYEDFIQTDAAINPGNSGGPLVNIDGEVVGINTAIASRTGGYQGIGFAIPSNSAKLIMDELIKNGAVRRGRLGVHIQDVNEALAKSYGLADVAGAVVSMVEPGSQAERAGVKKDDIIIKFNGLPIGGAAELKNLVGKERPDSTAKLTIFRSKKTLDVAVKIGERPQQVASTGDLHPDSATAGELGIQLGKVSSLDASKLGLNDREALIVKAVRPDGTGSKLGLQPGDAILEVDGAPISDVTTFKTKVSEAKKNKVIRLTVQRGKDVLILATSMA